MGNPTIDAGKQSTGMIKRRGDKNFLDIIAKTEIELAAVDVKLTGTTNTTIAKPKYTTRLATVADPGTGNTIVPPVGQDFQCLVTTVGASETRVLGTPDHLGQMATIVHSADGGDFAMTNASGWKGGGASDDVATFSEVEDTMVVIAVGTAAVTDWRFVADKAVVFA